MIRNLKLTACALAGILVSTAAAQADVIYSTLTNSVAGYASITASLTQAQSFTTGSNSYTLNSVTLSMPSTVSGGSFSVGLYMDAANKPASSPLLVLTGSGNPEAAGDYTYMGAQALAPNTTYWVCAAATDNGGYFVKDTAVAPTVGSGIGRYFSNDSGATWAGPLGNAFVMQVNATPVPEPSSISLLALGGLALLRRKR